MADASFLQRFVTAAPMFANNDEFSVSGAFDSIFFMILKLAVFAVIGFILSGIIPLGFSEENEFRVRPFAGIEFLVLTADRLFSMGGSPGASFLWGVDAETGISLGAFKAAVVDELSARGKLALELPPEFP